MKITDNGKGRRKEVRDSEKAEYLAFALLKFFDIKPEEMFKEKTISSQSSSQNKKSNLTHKQVIAYGQRMFDMGRGVKKNKAIIKWLKEIVMWNGHDKAWIEKTIEKLEAGK